MCLRCVSVIFAVALLVGCSTGGGKSLPNPDPKAAIDQSVEEDIVELQERPAVDFLARGGKHYDDADRPGSTVDKDVLLPLCQRLASEFKLQPIAIVDESEAGEYIYEIIVKLPGDAVARGEIRAAITQADADFQGRIVTEWGHKWLAFTLEPPPGLE